MADVKYKVPLLKKLAIFLFNLLPLAVAWKLIDLIFSFRLTVSAGFFAKHYKVRDLPALKVRGQELFFLNDESVISQLLFFLGTKGYEDHELTLW